MNRRLLPRTNQSSQRQNPKTKPHCSPTSSPLPPLTIISSLSLVKLRSSFQSQSQHPILRILLLAQATKFWFFLSFSHTSKFHFHFSLSAAFLSLSSTSSFFPLSPIYFFLHRCSSFCSLSARCGDADISRRSFTSYINFQFNSGKERD